MENNKYLNFRKLNEQETELYIYGDIRKKDWIDNWLGTGKEKTDAFTLKDALAQIDTPELTVRINSYGGSVSEGLAIYNLLTDIRRLQKLNKIANYSILRNTQNHVFLP